MSPIKPAKSLLLASLLIAFYACTTKNEVPQPVVDTARVDALRTQLIALQQQVLGAQQTTSKDSLTLSQLQAEIAQLQAYLQRTVSYTVTVNSFLFKPLGGATVKLSQGGKIVSATTASNGNATFAGLYAGIITATVDLTGFARLVFRADIRNNIDGASAYSTNSKVLMIPLGGTPQADSCMTVQYWKLYANYNMVDDTLGGPVVQQSYFNTTPASNPLLALPAGPNLYAPNVSYTPVTTQTITATLNQYSFLDGNGYISYAIPVGFTGWDAVVNNTGLTGNGQVVSATYENTIWTATAGANGIYTIKLPASDISNVTSNVNNLNINTASSFGFRVDFGEFTHDFTQYTTSSVGFGNFSTPYIINGSYPALPTYASTYIYRVNSPGGWEWTSNQTTSLTSAWPFFYNGTLK